MKHTQAYGTDSIRIHALKTLPHALTLVSLGGGLPVLCADDGQAHLALLVDVGVVDARLEGDAGRLERVLRGEHHLDAERALVVRGRVLWRRALIHMLNN